ncbi:MAG: hypothetical protein COB04_14450 [Gammaproteobacteria bacterium]|nr:MAG: hypothetical protein COB04_14450 [Gammaproteobacteria bacterium]
MSALAQEVILKSQEPLVYAQRFGLSRDPFQDDGVEGLFYPGAGRRECLDRLHHLSRYGHYLVHIVAEQGLGKSHLARMFYSQSQDQGSRISFIDSPVMMGPDQMMRVMAKGFGVALEEHDTALRILEKLFMLARQLKPELIDLVTIIDDAHQLAADSLTLLLSIVDRAKNEKIGIHFVLLAEPQFTKLLAQPQLKEAFDRCSDAMTLDLMNASETQQYIDYRLQTAGYSGAFPFSSKLMQQLFQQSKGVPLRINQLAGQLLFQQASQPIQKQWGLPPVHLASVVVLGALLMALVFWNQESRDSHGDGGLDGSLVERANSKSGVKVDESGAFLSKGRVLDSERAAQAAEAQSLGAISPETVSPEVIKKPRLPTVAELRRLAKPELLSGVASSDSGEIFEPGTGPREKVPLSASGGVQTFAIQQQSALRSESAGDKTPEQSIKRPASVAVAPSEVSDSVVSGVEALSSEGVQSDRWLRSRDPEHFTLQLLGAHNYEAVKSFIDANQTVGDLAQFSTSRQGLRWYVVVYGDFLSREVAVKAIDRIPESFQTLKPWVRSFASVHNDLGRKGGN